MDEDTCMVDMARYFLDFVQILMNFFVVEFLLDVGRVAVVPGIETLGKSAETDQKSSADQLCTSDT
jgi:hypothetical protein